MTTGSSLRDASPAIAVLAPVPAVGSPSSSPSPAIVVLADQRVDPVCVLREIWRRTAPSRQRRRTILNQATTYYLAALAVAIGFRMNLFNIGVDGQYRLAAFAAAAVGGERPRCPARCTSW